MNNPEAIRFVNETVRPLAEKIRALKAELNAARVTWYSGMNANFNKGTELVEDGRDAEGVSRLACDDVINFMSQAIKTAEAEASAWNDQVVSKPCVRAFHVL